MTLLLASLIDASIVLALALAATMLLRRRSAALRHAILALAIVCAILMPALEWWLPSIPVIPWGRGANTYSSGVTLLPADAAGNLSAIGAAPVVPSLSWLSVAGVVWLSGSAIAFIGLAIGFLRLRRLRQRSVPVTGTRRDQTDALARQCGVRRPVALLSSRDHTPPVTYGVIAPGIILPAGAEHWSDERWHIVLRHELAHIARGDAALQVVGELLRILQPLNPLVWMACRRLRQESEYACDDEVLGGGVAPTDYAAHLLDVAKDVSGRHVAIAAASAIAHPSTLERRVMAMLRHTTNRTPLTRRGWLAMGLVALSLSLPIAAAGVVADEAVSTEPVDISLGVQGAAPMTMTTAGPVRLAAPRASNAGRPSLVRPVTSQSQAASIAGQVVDQTGGTMPGVTITVIDKQTGQAAAAVTDPAGRFVLRDLPAGDYALTGTLPGFSGIAASFTLLPGAAITPRFTMAVGSLSETITVLCAVERFSLVRALFPILEASQAADAPIRVGGSVRPPKKIRDVRPACPAGIVTADVGIVLKGRVDETGSMTDVMLDDSEGGAVPPAELVNAAVDAVRQWQFTPTELNRQPIAVNIRVHVNFTLR